MSNPYESPEPTSRVDVRSTPAKPWKQRHGCATAWLVLMMISNLAVAIITPLSGESIQKVTPGFPVWVVWPIAVFGALNVVFAFALFCWKKWGFYGFAVTALIGSGINLYVGIALSQVIGGFAGVLVLFLVLQIGGERKAWTQLE